MVGAPVSAACNETPGPSFKVRALSGTIQLADINGAAVVRAPNTSSSLAYPRPLHLAIALRLCAGTHR